MCMAHMAGIPFWLPPSVLGRVGKPEKGGKGTVHQGAIYDIRRSRNGFYFLPR